MSWVQGSRCLLLLGLLQLLYVVILRCMLLLRGSEGRGLLGTVVLKMVLLVLLVLHLRTRPYANSCLVEECLGQPVQSSSSSSSSSSSLWVADGQLLLAMSCQQSRGGWQVRGAAGWVFVCMQAAAGMAKDRGS
jgi:hypothetical protein